MHALLSFHFSVDEWPTGVMDLVMELARGHPIHSIELLRSIKRRNLIAINNGQCTLTREDGSDLDTVKTTLYSLESLITDRLEFLTPHQKLVIKVGFPFSCNSVFLFSVCSLFVLCAVVLC